MNDSIIGMTLPELKDAHRIRLQELIDFAGTPRHLARMLDVGIMRARGWEERGRISIAGAEMVETHPKLGGKFTANYLRPDREWY